VGEAICASPCDESSAGATQLPAPPRPVCRYSGNGWEAARAFARSFCVGLGFEICSLVDLLDVGLAIEVSCASSTYFLILFCHFQGNVGVTDAFVRN